MAVLLADGKELVESVDAVVRQCVGVEKLFLLLTPVVHIALFGAVLRWIAVIFLDEVHYFAPVGVPAFVLCHWLQVDMN